VAAELGEEQRQLGDEAGCAEEAEGRLARAWRGRSGVAAAGGERETNGKGASERRRGRARREEDLIALGKEKEGAAAKPPEEVLVGVRVSVEVGCRLAGWALPRLAGGRTLPFFLLKRFPFYYFLVFF
jgi:hypothetical protein